MEHVARKAMAGGLIGLVAWRTMNEAQKQKVVGFLDRLAVGAMEAAERQRESNWLEGHPQPLLPRPQSLLSPR